MVYDKWKLEIILYIVPGFLDTAVLYFFVSQEFVLAYLLLIQYTLLSEGMCVFYRGEKE